MHVHLRAIGYDVKTLSFKLPFKCTFFSFSNHFNHIWCAFASDLKKMVDIVLNHSNVQYSVDVTLYFYYTSILAIPPSFGVSKTLDIINNKNFTPKIYKSNANCGKKWYNNHFFPMKIFC